MRPTESRSPAPAYAAIAVFGLVLVTVTAAVVTRATLTQLVVNDMQALAQTAVAAVEPHLACDPEHVRSTLSRLTDRAVTGGASISVYDAAVGSMLLSTQASSPFSAEALSGIWSGIPTGGVRRGSSATSGDRGPTLVYGAAALGSAESPCFIVVATRHIGTVTGPAATVAVAVLMAALVIAAFIVGMARILSLRRGNQIRLLQEAAGRYARGELELPFRLKGPPEIAVLAHALQTMAEQLQLRIRAIRHQRNELETILASMAEGVIVLDANRRIRSMNHAAATLLRVESVGSTGKSVIQHIRNAELDDLATAAMASGESVEREITVYRDSPIHLRVHVTPLSREGGTHRRGILIVASDITRIKQLQQMRKDFVANVSHELKTPITSIKGFVETLLDGGVDDPDQSQRFLQIILNHANRLNLIIEDLLSLSRLEQGRLQLRFEECDVENLAAAALDVCAPAAKAKQIRVRTSHSGNPIVRVNPNLIEQALVNLLDNAVKYSDECSDVELELASDDQHFTVTVRDNGQGIPARDLPRVFERFFRTDRARSRELGGTGLGLAIVKHIARAHGGDVSVQSTLGEGSAFTVCIPQQPTAGDAAVGEHTAGRRVPVE